MQRKEVKLRLSVDLLVTKDETPHHHLREGRSLHSLEQFFWALLVPAPNRARKMGGSSPYQLAQAMDKGLECEEWVDTWV